LRFRSLILPMATPPNKTLQRTRTSRAA